MKALILNSGTGSRMGEITKTHPKCMTPVSERDTILSLQLRSLYTAGIRDVVITTGAYDTAIRQYCASLKLEMNYTFVKNERYDKTNYIYSIALAAGEVEDDVLLMHGDLVFEQLVLDHMLDIKGSVVAVSAQLPLPEKDFKAVVKDGRVCQIGIEFFTDALASQPLYKLEKNDWLVWLAEIKRFCEKENVNCYAENALNAVSDSVNLSTFDYGNKLCAEIDTPEDLAIVTAKLAEVAGRTVYMCFSADVLHGGHIRIIQRAAALGHLTIGILADNAVASYKRFPILSFEERKALFSGIKGVEAVVEQKTLNYADVLKTLKPDYVVHGDDWRTGFQLAIRNEVTSVLAEYGGQLVEYPYAVGEEYQRLEQQARAQLSIPDIRRGRLRKLLEMKQLITVIEAHSGITGLIAEKTVVYQNGGAHQFDGMWVSSLCDSTAKGKPDIELVDMSSRIRTIDDIMEVTTKPIILDGDTGGLTEHFVYNVRTLERMGVSAVIIEDKTGLKKNSLFGNDVVQTQDSIENFSAKIRAGKAAQKTKEFMIISRIESLILDRGMEDALERATAFVAAGADGIMIHSRKKQPDEIFEFIEKFRVIDPRTPIVVVPTSFNAVTEEEFAARGVNIVIYANQLTRSGFPAMQNTARTILENHRAKEADDLCMSIKDILTLIPEE